MVGTEELLLLRVNIINFTYICFIFPSRKKKDIKTRDIQSTREKQDTEPAT